MFDAYRGNVVGLVEYQKAVPGLEVQKYQDQKVRHYRNRCRETDHPDQTLIDQILDPEIDFVGALRVARFVARLFRGERSLTQGGQGRRHRVPVRELRRHARPSAKLIPAEHLEDLLEDGASPPGTSASSPTTRT